MNSFISEHFNRLIAFLLVFFSVLLSIQIYFDQRYSELSSTRYQEAALQADKILSTLLQSQQEKGALAALYLSQLPSIKQSLLLKDRDLLDFQYHFDEGQKFGSLRHDKIQIIDATGHSFYRNWTDLSGDRIVENRKDLVRFFEDPKIMHTMSVGIYDLTMKTIVPIYDGDTFLGAFEIIGSLDGVINRLSQSGIVGLALLDENYRFQMLEQDSQYYIGDSFIVTKKAHQTAVMAIKASNALNVPSHVKYHLCDTTDWYMSFKHLEDVDGVYMATFYLFQPLEPIIENFSLPVTATFSFVNGLFLLLLVSYIGWYFYRNSLISTASNRNLRAQVENSNRALHSQALFWQKVIDGLDDILLVVHKSPNQLLMNQAAETIFDIRKSNEVSCRVCSEILFDEDRSCNLSEDECMVQKSFATKKVLTRVEEIQIDGSKRYFEFTVTPILDKRGQVSQVVEVGHDITPYVEAQQQVERQKNRLDEIAYFDSLTGLPNRRLFLDRLQQAIIHAQRNGLRVAVLFIDLDFFKTINDTYGHDCGDKVLIECSEKIKESVRKSDTVSRLGGDEFTVIIEQVGNSSAVADIVNSILEAINQPISVDDHKFYLSASIGISVYPDDGKSTYDLIRSADTAMYEAKDNGRNAYAYYNPEMTQRAMQRIALETRLRTAIEERQFEAYYQPQFDMTNMQITGFEALVRWNDPEHGVILPFEFISLAEETSIILPIGQQMMFQAMQTIREWHELGLTKGRMAINLSAKQFANQDLLNVIKDTLQETGCEPDWVELEITETSVMKNRTYAARVLSEFKEMGISISIDDFGTGYSSLAQLKRMPIDKIKIDQSFIYELPHDNEDAEITKTIINMAKNLGLSTVAEGVENTSQSDFMKKFGCVNAQGFLFSKALTKSEMEAKLREHQQR